LFILLCVRIAIVFTWDLVAALKVYDEFNDIQIDQKLWDTDYSNGLFTQSDGLLRANTSHGLYSDGISPRIAFLGDFEVILDWRDYPVSFFERISHEF